mmetsp:Transcript_9282/g.28089  ORF Transcript_9282/g.28089 Transcript_9282/m.28089 type:complete len:103 (-) Transcript_9282:372-680(-)
MFRRGQVARGRSRRGAKVVSRHGAIKAIRLPVVAKAISHRACRSSGSSCKTSCEVATREHVIFTARTLRNGGQVDHGHLAYVRFSDFVVPFFKGKEQGQLDL